MMFLGMLMVDASLAAWAVGLRGQPTGPRWVVWVLPWLAITFLVSAGPVLEWLARTTFEQEPTAAPAGVEQIRDVSSIAPAGAALAGIALLVATRQSRTAKRAG